MKLLTLCILLVGLVSNGTGKSVKCEFKDRSGIYTCYLRTSNLTYGDVPRQIEGSHEEGKTNDDVKGIFGSSQQLKRFTSLFCENFENLEQIYAWNMKIESVDENAFLNCRNLRKIYLYNNNIKQLPQKLFENQKELITLDLNYNQLSSLPVGIFHGLDKLENLRLLYNELKTIHADSFGTHPKLFYINLGNNKLTSFDERIIDNTAVTELGMLHNLCANIKTEERNEIKSKMAQCFKAYKPRTTQQVSTGRTTVTTTEQPKTQTVKQPNFSQTSQQTEESCGRSKMSQGTIYGGNHIKRGTHPWHAALKYKKHLGSGYFCGGILASERKVITAAHCINQKGSADLTENDFVTLLGVFDLSDDLEDGRTPYGIEKIFIHPDYNKHSMSFDADIAVLFTTQKVLFNNFIQPICLLNHDSPAAKEPTGVAVGYGRSENRAIKHETIPKKIEMPIVASVNCIWSDERLYIISSKRTICIGSRNGNGTCKGDSGGGLYVQNNGIYYLRGIISSSPFIGFDECDLSTYSVATDMLNYYDWVKNLKRGEFLFDRK